MKPAEMAKHFGNEDAARAFLERMRWPDGAVCPHCGVVGEAYRLTPKPTGKTHVRKGVWKCGACREQFTVTVATIFEDSHIQLHKWLFAIHLLCASKKGMSAHQLHRMLGITYKSAWFMMHRIRYAMAQPPFADKLKGVVEADETYIGGKECGKRGKPGRDSKKTPVLALVERGGRVRSMPMRQVTAKNLRQALQEHIASEAEIHTDEAGVYHFAKKAFAGHEVVNHSKKEYARRSGGKLITTNTAEGFCGLLKRGVYGVYHHVGRQHLHRYLAEFDFRYNARKISDDERALLAVKGIGGKRLTYRDS